jgi:hypothetical protein
MGQGERAPACAGKQAARLVAFGGGGGDAGLRFKPRAGRARGDALTLWGVNVRFLANFLVARS